MTGPRIRSVHPHRRRGRLLLPFLAAIVLGPVACTDRPTESTPVQSTPSAATSRPHPYLKLPSGTSSMRAATSPGISASVAAASVAGPKVLLLADVDEASTLALAGRLVAAGFQVTARPAPEYTWNGTDPALTGFDAVVHLNGATYDGALAPAAQRTLASFVQNGGGFVGGQWNGYERSQGLQTQMPDLVLQGYYDETSENCADCDITYNTVTGQEGHPVLAGIPSSFTFRADGHDAGPPYAFSSDPATVLMRVPSGGPAVLVRQFALGKVVNFSFAANYPNYDLAGNLRMVTLLDPTVQQLYVNAVRWVAGSPSIADQTITFAPLSDKTFGDPPFTVSATASSNLPVNFTSAGDCTVFESTVTLTGAGTCSIAAHQPGNESYNPAVDVVLSFEIAKGPATLALGNLSQTYNGSPLAATATTTPAGLAGVAITYDGSATPPTNAGSYAVTATLTNDDYLATPVSGTLVIAKAPATLSVGTEFVYDGTAKEAVVSSTPTGLSGITVTYSQNGIPVTNPVNAGTYQALAHLEHQNYQAPDARGLLIIRQATPLIHWEPASITVGTPLGDAQLNATATGVGGTPVSGDYIYNPPEGTRLPPGSRTLSVQFRSSDLNYTGATKTVQVSVLYRFVGFFRPVKNPPIVNNVRAGRAIPIKFSLGSFEGMRVLQPDSPTSRPMVCGASSGQTMAEEDEPKGFGGLRADGSQYTYIWKTSVAWAGTCRRLILTLDDGSSHAVLFRFARKPKQPAPAKGRDKDDESNQWRPE